MNELSKLRVHITSKAKVLQKRCVVRPPLKADNKLAFLITLKYQHNVTAVDVISYNPEGLVPGQHFNITTRRPV